VEARPLGERGSTGWRVGWTRLVPGLQAGPDRRRAGGGQRGLARTDLRSSPAPPPRGAHRPGQPRPRIRQSMSGPPTSHSPAQGRGALRTSGGGLRGSGAACRLPYARGSSAATIPHFLLDADPSVRYLDTTRAGRSGHPGQGGPAGLSALSLGRRRRGGWRPLRCRPAAIRSDRGPDTASRAPPGCRPPGGTGVMKIVNPFRSRSIRGFPSKGW